MKVCPTNVFDSGQGEAPTITRQEDCQTCSMCDAYCPADVLYVAPELDHSVAVDEDALGRAGKLGEYRELLGWATAARTTACSTRPICCARCPGLFGAKQVGSPSTHFGYWSIHRPAVVQPGLRASHSKGEVKMVATVQMLGTWSGINGSLEIRRLSECVVYLRCVGANDQPAGPIIERSLERHFEEFPTLAMFWDLEDLTSYHSDLRVCTTRVLISHRKQLQAIHAYARSKLVWMGISVASLALGGLVTSHSSRESFEAALQESLEKPV